MNSYPKVRLKNKSLKSIQRLHPWIFSGGLELDGTLKDGEKVRVEDPGKKIVATGHYSTGSIAVRVLEFAHTSIDENFYLEKLSVSMKLRKELGLPSAATNCFRLVHGEGDGLPGLIIDIYNNVAVVQAHSAGMQNDFDLIKLALLKLSDLNIDHVIPLSAEKQRRGSLAQDLPRETIVCENELQFKVNWAEGQKTGFFLDQRENRKLVGSLAKDKKVLNAFSYTGGFSISALHGGAIEVHSLDSSKKATTLCDEHVELNQFKSARHRSLTEDALKYLSSEAMANEAYDLIVLDPPAFAKHRSARHKAVQAYKRINALAMKQIKPGGLLFTFSCSQVVSPELFNNTIAAAAIEVGRKIQVVRILHQPDDHPVNIYHPEGEYLKGLFLRIL